MSSMARQANGLTKAERTANTNCFQERPRNIASIDFGTTHCSVSYLLNASDAGDQKKAEMLFLGDNERVPTCILFNQVGERKFFGAEARDEYMSLERDERPHFIYFEYVKMKLQHDQAVDRKLKVYALNGKQYFLIDIIAHILCHLKEALLEVIKDFGMEYDSTDFHWVITVPAIWKAKGKKMMREAGYKAGLCTVKSPSNLRVATGVAPRAEIETSPEKLSLALEPESAAVHCQLEAKQAKKGAGEKFLPSAKNYLVVDIGGGTVDIATHSFVDGGIIELAPSTGNDWGGTRVNKEFEDFLGRFVSDPKFSRYLNKNDETKYVLHKADLATLVYKDFEAQKISFGKGASTKSFKITFKRSFYKVYENDLLRGGCRKEKGIKIEDDGEVMRLSREKMEEFFMPAVNGIKNLLKSHIREHHLADVIETVYFVGGFGGSKYLREQIEQVLEPHWTSSVPPRPDLAVIYGATAFRNNPGIVTQRRADASYGIAIRAPFDEDKHRPDYKYWNSEKEQYYCCHLFNAFVSRGDFISTNEVFIRTYCPLSSDQASVHISMYSADREEIWYVTDEHVYKLGELDIEIGGSGLDREIEVVLDVTHAELKLLARDKTTGKERKLVADFLKSR